ERNEPSDHGAEHEDQDDQRRWEAELKLARLEVVLRKVVEIVVERSPARHHDTEALLAVIALDEAKQLVDVGLALDANEDGVPVAGDAESRKPVDHPRCGRLRAQTAEERAECR